MGRGLVIVVLVLLCGCGVPSSTTTAPLPASQESRAARRPDMDEFFAKWLKIVYFQNGGNPITVAVTLDNADHPGLTDAVTRLNWPRRNGSCMAKQSIVVK